MAVGEAVDLTVVVPKGQQSGRFQKVATYICNVLIHTIALDADTRRTERINDTRCCTYIYSRVYIIISHVE